MVDVEGEKKGTGLVSTRGARASAVGQRREDEGFHVRQQAKEKERSRAYRRKIGAKSSVVAPDRGEERRVCVDPLSFSSSLELSLELRLKASFLIMSLLC